MRILEALGRLVGGIWAPWAALGSLTRNARIFHPDGLVYWAKVEPVAKEGPVGDLAKRLQGIALIRLSSAWWRYDKEWPDILGIALRFVDTKMLHVQAPQPRDQDLLFATIPNTLLFPVAPMLTNTHDFFGNDYHALFPFSVEGLGRVKFRLMPMRLPSDWGKRRDNLDARIGAGTAVFRLEIKTQKIAAKWREVAVIDIRDKALIDQQVLEFNPFRSGRGIVPVGPLQMLRAATYKASYLGRTATKA